MSDKISPVAVVKEALAVSWARKGTLVGVMILGIMPSLLMVGIQLAYPDLAAVVGIVGFACVMVVSCFVYVMLNHTAISQMRGEDDFFPKNMVLAMWRVFVRGLIAYLGMALPMLIGMLPFILIILYGAGPGGEISTGLFTAGVIFAFIGWLAGFGLMLRLAVMIPGAATGRVVKVKEALAMTKGHVWRMVGSLVMTILPMIVLQILFVTVLGPSGGEAQDGGFPVLPFILLLAVACIVSLVAFVTLPVWYEKLRLRQEAMASAPSAE
ncbi:hypothetical protein [Pseudodesulfovibrio portus]|uniref:Glycerophosphoryl diester phosphodiesterase membrane domain-containing protein n=1 Tax=Pseudodesulfovibrio portus TaxID=231439 RepID=A0ABM8AQZ4_9BACT|nr:hypothetical protein [Pseudodesulfovibrio portus]BDQ33839.1 hypothetical protein JCM14722_13810 [Pseudodesulfovibrio portus]